MSSMHVLIAFDSGSDSGFDCRVLASTLEMVGLIEYGPQKDVHEDAFSARGRTENNLRLILWLAAPGLMSIRS